MDAYVHRVCAEIGGARLAAGSGWRKQWHCSRAVDSRLLWRRDAEFAERGADAAVVCRRCAASSRLLLKARGHAGVRARATGRGDAGGDAAPGDEPRQLRRAVICGSRGGGRGAAAYAGDVPERRLRGCGPRGSRNINVDLIVGLPRQTAASWRESVEVAIESGVPHVSVYMLEVDEDSRLGREMLKAGNREHGTGNTLKYGAGDVPSRGRGLRSGMARRASGWRRMGCGSTRFRTLRGRGTGRGTM
jgi:DNA-directed RNA polymerase subunit RPC12/RpoP